MNSPIFYNRQEAGEILAPKLLPYKNLNPLVLAIPRGGVVIGKAVADALSCPLSVVLVKKISSPFNPECAVGAIGPDGQVFLEETTAADPQEISRIRQQITERKKALKLPDLRGKTVIVVDDGIATGATMAAALLWVKSQKPQKIVAAAPCSLITDSYNLSRLADEIIVLSVSSTFHAVSQFYENFPQVSDAEVKSLLCAP